MCALVGQPPQSSSSQSMKGSVTCPRTAGLSLARSHRWCGMLLLVPCGEMVSDVEETKLLAIFLSNGLCLQAKSLLSATPNKV